MCWTAFSRHSQSMTELIALWTKASLVQVPSKQAIATLFSFQFRNVGASCCKIIRLYVTVHTTLFMATPWSKFKYFYQHKISGPLLCYINISMAMVSHGKTFVLWRTYREHWLEKDTLSGTCDLDIMRAICWARLTDALIVKALLVYIGTYYMYIHNTWSWKCSKGDPFPRAALKFRVVEVMNCFHLKSETSWKPLTLHSDDSFPSVPSYCSQIPRRRSHELLPCQ